MSNVQAVEEVGVTLLHVTPPSRDTCTISPAAKVELLPAINNVGSLVVKSVALTPVSVVIDSILEVEIGPVRLIVTI